MMTRRRHDDYKYHQCFPLKGSARITKYLDNKNAYRPLTFMLCNFTLAPYVTICRRQIFLEKYERLSSKQPIFICSCISIKLALA